MMHHMNHGKREIWCRFFINTMENSDQDGKQPVFGRVLKGKELVRRLEGLHGVGEDRGKIMGKVLIKDCIVYE